MAVNEAKFATAWPDGPPRWAAILADECRRQSHRAVADRLQVSGAYVSRILYNDYPARMDEAERKVLATFGGDRVDCPLWPKPIPLAACLRSRRRTSPPRNQFHHAYDRACPSCPNNTDREPSS